MSKLSASDDLHTVIDSPDDALRHDGHTKVEEQSHGFPCEAKVGKELRRVYRQHHFDSLQFQNDGVLDHKIQHQCLVEHFTFIGKWQLDLGLNAQVTLDSSASKHRS